MRRWTTSTLTRRPVSGARLRYNGVMTKGIAKVIAGIAVAIITAGVIAKAQEWGYFSRPSLILMVVLLLSAAAMMVIGAIMAKLRTGRTKREKRPKSTHVDLTPESEVDKEHRERGEEERGAEADSMRQVVESVQRGRDDLERSWDEYAQQFSADAPRHDLSDRQRNLMFDIQQDGLGEIVQVYDGMFSDENGAITQRHYVRIREQVLGQTPEEQQMWYSEIEHLRSQGYLEMKSTSDPIPVSMLESALFETVLVFSPKGRCLLKDLQKAERRKTSRTIYPGKRPNQSGGRVERPPS